MKASTVWLQKYFDEPLPGREEIADAYTFHAFEIDSVEGNTLDVKVLPNRAADCLCHRGLAKELGAILDRPFKSDPLRGPVPTFPTTDSLSADISDPRKCPRYMAALVKGVKVGLSPDWLRQALESVGGRSINNIVDATNYVMLDLGQPLHAFDADKLMQKDGTYAIGVRGAKPGEKITTLTGDTYALTPERLVITDAHADMPIAIAGVKGGQAAEVTDATTNVIIESANFDGTSVRRTAQALKLVTDASLRFQNRPSPELCAYGMQAALNLIVKAGGEAVGVVDAYPNPATRSRVSTTLARINGLLGSDFTTQEVQNVCHRLDLPCKADSETFTITPPFERTDLIIPEDIAEEVGRLLGYERIAPSDLPPLSGGPDQARYRGIERMKDQLIEQGFTEVSTQSFVKKGDVYLANPLDQTRPALRVSLEKNLADALERAKRYSPLVLSPGEEPKLFEVGTVFPKAGEYLELRMTEPAWEGVPSHDNLSIAKLEEYGKDYEPKHHKLGGYEPFSAYPFVLRDIALWAPPGTDVGFTKSNIEKEAGDLLARCDLFDTFEKEGRTSYAFRLVFESMERTLTDEEINGIMEKISAALTKKGYEIR
jgi:phenylalanyl-tRNA synthetase beta chain